MVFKKIGYYLVGERDGAKFKIEFDNPYFTIHVEKAGVKRWFYPFETLEMAKLNCELIDLKKR
jgi:hypothetical protein